MVCATAKCAGVCRGYAAARGIEKRQRSINEICRLRADGITGSTANNGDWLIRFGGIVWKRGRKRADRCDSRYWESVGDRAGSRFADAGGSGVCANEPGSGVKKILPGDAAGVGVARWSGGAAARVHAEFAAANWRGRAAAGVYRRSYAHRALAGRND